MDNRFIKFNDEQLDAKKVMMLQDLARLLLKNNQTKVKIQKFPYYDPTDNVLSASAFWSHRSADTEIKGLKSDILLATYGYMHMDPQIVNEVLEDTSFTHVKFFKQLFKLLEDMRILNLIAATRPSTQHTIQLRKQTRLQFTEAQIKVYRTKATDTDLLFLYIEQALLTENFYDVPVMKSLIDDVLIAMFQYLPDFFQNQSSEDNMYLAMRIMHHVDDLLNEDMLNEYYHIPRQVYEALADYTLEDIRRHDPSQTDGKQDNTDDTSDIATEQAETKSADSKTQGGAYLEMELHEGENSDVASDNDSARDGDASDDITDMQVQKGRGTENNAEDEGGEQGGHHDAFALKGINEHVKIITHRPEIQPEYDVAYQNVKTDVQFETKDLIQIIKKTIDREFQDTRHNLAKGRLQKNLLNWFLDDQYRLFYKQQDASQTFDATFTLLIDASASMEDKMDETIKGVVLFHETLKALNVKHEILAFNEDGFDADPYVQPNIIDEIITYDQSLYTHDSSRIMALEPQDDNRDGVAIRYASERLLRRPNKQKFLIVFSDGEPSAFNYSSDGILDTYEAVETARKYGIEIFNVFLSQDPITENITRTVHNIYGDYALFVEGVEHLPSLLSPLLKKLLLKSF